MDKITTINGVLMATQNDFTEHVENANIHIMEEERTAWNAKADAHELGSKLDTDVFTAHESNAVKHVSTEEREKWNRAPETDAAGNMALAGNLTAAGGSFTESVHAGAGINIPVSPVADTDAARKLDLSRPLFLPDGNNKDTLGWNLFVRNGRPTTYFGHLVNLDDPVLILQNCVQQGDNFAGHLRGEYTYLSLIHI